MNGIAEDTHHTAQMQTLQYGNLKIFYKPELDGAGSVLAEPFVNFIRQYSRYQSFPRVFEWCSGPAFIGFAMLAEQMCDHLIVADINPEAMECVKKTVEANHLHDRVTYYVSDNFANIPANEKFDLVVANPPRYVNINPKHKLGALYHNDKRAIDRDWEIHHNFYLQISSHLNAGAHLFISEIEPFRQSIYIPHSDKTPYDIRVRMPITDFKEMISDGGLVYVDAKPYYTIIEGVTAWIVCSKKPAKLWRRLLYNVNTLK